MAAESNNKSEKLVSAEEVLELCCTDLKAMHNLQFLVVDLIQPSEPLETYLRKMDHHLQHLTDVLCRRVQTEDAKPDKARNVIVGVDRIDDDQVIVEFSDKTTATYTVDDLASLPNARVKANLPIPERTD